MKNGKYLYSFRDPKMAYEQEVGYVEKAEKKDAFSAENYAQKKSTFGLIVFKSKADLDPLDVYLAYAQRWEIETMFYLFKNIIDRDIFGELLGTSLHFCKFVCRIEKKVVSLPRFSGVDETIHRDYKLRHCHGSR